MAERKVLDIGVPWLLAIATLVMWFVTIALMWNRLNVDETTWGRMMSIMTALQSLAFAAAGALWGVKVQSVETDKAKDGEAKAKEDKSKAVDVAREGKTLADMLDQALARGGSGTINLRADDVGMSGLREQARKVRAMALP
ncbi:hypothetical protein ABID19_004004 [Mesorhizobium robiniae]|uniref:Uncharacterized protein n=1 Tax=Mesorhizobium robiniae TaxID=559315 RepID=A0ABV2GRP1_9HYPH